jgi:hypothetical protein
MAFVVRGLYDVEEDFKKLASVPDRVYDQMLDAASEVMVKETSNAAKTMLVGPYYTGDLANHIKRGRMRKSAKNGRYTDILFYGNVVDKHHPNGERRATIAYINEYGKRKQPARPFISVAIDAGSVPAVDAAAEVYYDYLKL